MDNHGRILFPRTALFLFVIMIGVICGAMADIICVTVSGSGSCHNSLSGAVTAADEGDIIRVAGGTYKENVVIDKSLALEGGWNEAFTERDPKLHLTTIDGKGAASVFRVKGGVEASIDGFIITNGNASSPLGWGGGIMAGESMGDPTTVIIRNNIIRDNVGCDNNCQGHGGGICLYSSYGLIENNEIYNNTAQVTAGKGGKGGGIYVGWMASADIISNEIHDNLAAESPSGGWTGKGGGICSTDSSVNMHDNHIYNNIAARDGPGDGGGIHGIGQMTDNRILSNKASINGEGRGGGIYAENNKDILSNRIEKNIASQNGDGSGGGIYAIQLDEVRFNQIIQNLATRGAGIYMDEYCHAEVKDNVISENEATGNNLATMDGGGGISTKDNNAEIIRNEIFNNSTKYMGGGILVMAGDNYTIKENMISHNTAKEGGGINVHSATGAIIQNDIHSNESVWGGGMYLWGKASPQLDRNKITENKASGLTGMAGGGIVITLDAGTIVILTNTIIARNSAGAGGVCGGVVVNQGLCRMFHCTIADNNLGDSKEGVYISSTEGPQFFWNNIVCGHSTGVYLNPAGSLNADHNNSIDNVTDINGATWGANHMSSTPGFEDRGGGDYHLASNSNLIDAGKTRPEADHDFDGDARPHGAEVDIGADEFYRFETHVSVEHGDDETGNGSPTLPFASIEKGITETRWGGEVMVAVGRYLEHLDIQKGVSLSGGFEYPSWSRNINENTTVIDGHGTGTVVLVRGEGVHAVIEGFSITGGYAWIPNGYGGGMMVWNRASADIRYNRIYGNVAEISGGGLALAATSIRTCHIESNRIYDNESLGLHTCVLAPKQKISQGMSEPGGGMFVYGGPLYIANNMVYHNYSKHSGDGMAVWPDDGKEARVLNNTIVDNGGEDGEGVYLSNRSSDTGENFIFHNNLVVGHDVGVTVTTDTLVNHDYNSYFENRENYKRLSPAPHDVFEDPCFPCRECGYLSLRHCSGVVDKGNPDGLFYPTRDIQGDGRPYGAGVDIGADELVNSPPMIRILSPDPEYDRADAGFILSWEDDDPEENAVISLYYDDDDAGFDGSLIHQPIQEDDLPNEYAWDTQGTPEGVYWIYGVIEDGVNPAIMCYNPHPLMITHVTPQEIVDHLLDRQPMPGARMPFADLDEDGSLSMADLVRCILLP